MIFTESVRERAAAALLGRGAGSLASGRREPLGAADATVRRGPGLSPHPGRGAGPRGVPAPAFGGRSAPGGAVPRWALSGERRFNGRRGSSRRARERRAGLGSRAPGFPLSPLTTAGRGTSRRAARARGGPTCARLPGGTARWGAALQQQLFTYGSQRNKNTMLKLSTLRPGMAAGQGCRCSVRARGVLSC